MTLTSICMFVYCRSLNSAARVIQKGYRDYRMIKSMKVYNIVRRNHSARVIVRSFHSYFKQTFKSMYSWRYMREKEVRDLGNGAAIDTMKVHKSFLNLNKQECQECP